MEAVDLTDIPIVDNHCHGIRPDDARLELTDFRSAFTESLDSGMKSQHVATTAFYRRLLHRLATFFDCESDEVVVLDARGRLSGRDLVRGLLRDANFEALLLDTGVPPSEEVLAHSELAELGSCRAEPMLRLENLMEDLIVGSVSLGETTEVLRAQLSDVRAQGFVALKSIVAYRTGLEIEKWSSEEAEASFREARRDLLGAGGRLVHKPVLDTLLHVAFEEAARQEVPMQFHVGYGDADTDLRLGNPLHLRSVLEHPEYRAMPVVLLHECYPYTREGGYLATIYENAYLDLSYAIPLLGYSEMLAFTRQALGVAPTSKLLYSSDGIGVPELHWMGAKDGRRVLGEGLGELVVHGELSVAGAEDAGEAVLRTNAARLYRL